MERDLSFLTDDDLEASSGDWFSYQSFYERVSQIEGFTSFVEVGCWKGYSTTFLADCLKRNKSDFELFAVDLWDEKFFLKRFRYDQELLKKYESIKDVYYTAYDANLKKFGVRDVVKDVRGISWEMAGEFEDKSLDFVYLDADHHFRSVINDIERWSAKIKDGGMLAGHDWQIKGVRRAVRHFFGRAGFTRDTECSEVWYVYPVRSKQI